MTSYAERLRAAATAPGGASESAAPAGGGGAPTSYSARLRAATAPPAASEPAAAPADAPGLGVGLARSAAQGATFNFADEIEAATRALADVATGQGSFQESYDRHIADIRSSIEAFRGERPGTAFAAEMAGGLAIPGLGTAGTVARGASTGARVARGLAAGAGTGALAGAGAAEGGLAERGAGAVPGAVVGAGIGAAVPGAAAGLGRVGRFWSRQRGAGAPTVRQLEDEAAALYSRARSAGVQIRPDSWTGLVDDVARTMADEGIDPTLHPRATAVLRRLIENRGQPVTLEQTETMRRVLRDAAASQAPDERRLARIMVDRFDDWRDSLKSADVLQGDVRATGLLAQARGLWSRAKKGEAIGELIQRAEDRANQFSQSGIENALRTEFRQLARNAKKMRTFSKEEQKAIRAVASGASLANAMRWLGKFAPRGPISLAITGGTGYAAGGPVGSLALMGLGEAGRAAAGKMTRNRALAAQELALLGRRPPMPAPSVGAGRLAGAVTPALTIPAAGRAAEGQPPPSQGNPRPVR